MTPNRVKLGRTATLIMEYLDSIASLIFLPKTLIWNKIKFLASNSLNFAELMENEVVKSISKKIINAIFLFLFNLSLLIVKTLRAYN